MGIFLVILLFLAFAYSLSLLLKLKSVEALFAALCSVMFLSILFTTLFSLDLSVYIILALIAVIFISSTIVSIVQKDLVQSTKDFFNSPALIMIFVILLVFSLGINGIKVRYWDDMSHWSTAPKAILHYNGINIPDGILITNQSFILPMYNAFITFITGFQQDIMIIFKWLFSLTCLLLPFSHFDMKKIKKTALYSVIIFSIILSTGELISIHLYSDLYLYSIWAGLIGYYYINKNKKSTFMVLMFGMAALPQMKYILGLIITAFLFIIIIFDMFYYKVKPSRKHVVFFSFSCVSILVNTLINDFIRSSIRITDPDFVSYNNMSELNISKVAGQWNIMYDNIINTIKSPLTIVILSVTVILVILYAVSLYKNHSNRKYYGLFTLLFIAVFIRQLYSGLDSQSIELTSVFLKSIRELTFLNMPFTMLMGFIIAICISYYMFILNDKYKEYFIILSSIIALQSLLILLLTLVRYSLLGSMVYVENAWSLDRYLGVMVYFVIFLIPMYFLGMDGIWDKFSKKTNKYILILTAVFILFGSTLQPIEVYRLKTLSNIYVEYFFDSQIDCGELVDECSKDGDSICIITDRRKYIESESTEHVLLRYYTMIPSTNYVWLDTQDNVDEQMENLSDFIKANNFTKVLYNKYNDDMDTVYSQLFTEPYEYDSPAMFDVVWENDKLKLKNSCK